MGPPIEHLETASIAPSVFYNAAAVLHASRTERRAASGVIASGSADITQLFTRPVARLDPYSTPNPRMFLCSSATPPGGGVHGLGGYFAAKSAARALRRGRI